MPIKKVILVSCLFVLLTAIVPLVHSETLDTSSGNLDTINKQLADLTEALSKSVAATKPLQSQLDSMQKQIANIKYQVTAVEADTVVKKMEIDNGYKRLTEKEKIISATIRDFYIKSYYDSPFLVFLSAGSASEMTQKLAYQHAKTEQDKSIITNIALSITDLEKKKAQLDQEKQWLTATNANLDQQTIKLDEIIKGAISYQKDVSGKIAELSAKQQEIINAKSGSFTFSMGDGELADEFLSSMKGFRESAPGGSFAIFSFGAYTHRNGMSQYGAKARAEAGQSYQAILSKYYPNATLETKSDIPGEINVDGYGTMSLEDRYLMGIAEMPSSWHAEALKVQAIAARTYAYAQIKSNYTCGGGGRGNILTNESCQAFLGSKADSPPQAWKDAVQATKGQILTKDGSPSSTQYSSTAGGWSNTSGWDTTDSAGGSNFIDKSYEKLGGSPWLYKAWWRKGYSNTGDTCGSANPWLSPQEMADIVNAHLVMTKGDASETGRVTPITTSCWGGNPYSIDELKTIASKYGGISSANSVSVSQGDGMTNNVTINGVSMTGKEFRNAVALRAPGYIRIPQGEVPSGWTFFNIEHK